GDLRSARGECRRDRRRARSKRWRVPRRRRSGSRGEAPGAARRPRAPRSRGRRGADDGWIGRKRGGERAHGPRLSDVTAGAMSRVVERAWRREGLGGRLIYLALLPASVLFSAIVRLRALAYRWRLRRRRVLPAAVVSVGNLSVGGTGKTPT